IAAPGYFPGADAHRIACRAGRPAGLPTAGGDSSFRLRHRRYPRRHRAGDQAEARCRNHGSREREPGIMAINDITLASGMRNNLINLQMVSALQSRTTQRLSTGKKVNSAIDDPSAFFAAQNATARAGDLSAAKSLMGEAIQT